MGKKLQINHFQARAMKLIVESFPQPLYRLVTPRTSRCGDLNKRKTNCKDHWTDVITVQII